MPPEPSSPDPLQDLDGPSIYNSTPAPRTIKHRTTSTIVSPRKSKLSHTTVVSTPTRSPWRIRVVVEAERDDEEEEGPASKRARMSKTKTTKVPLRGLSPVITVNEGDAEVVKKKSTPVRRRRRSTTATPGGPGKTPAKTRGRTGVTPVLEEEHVDEGIGPSEAGFEENDVSLVPVVVVPARTKATPRKNATPHKAATPRPRKTTTPRRSPSKRTPASRVPRTVASSSKAPPPRLEEEEESPPQASTRSALSPVSSNRILSPSPSPRKRSPVKARQVAHAPPPRPLLNFGSSTGSNDDDMEGFSMVDTNSLLPDFLTTLSHQQPEPEATTEVEIGNMLESEDDEDEDEEMDLPDFTFVSNGTSYTPHAKKSNIPPENQQEALFEDDPVATQSFYGIPEQGKQLFRSSPPPLLQVKAKNATTALKVTPILKPAEELPLPEQAQAMKTRKRRRSTPALDHAKLASEGLRSSMGVEESPRKMSMSMRSERFGSVLDQEEQEEQERYERLQEQNERKEEYARIAGEGDYAELEEMSDGDTDDGLEYPDLPAPAKEPVSYPSLEPEVLDSGGRKIDLKGKGKATPLKSALQRTPTAPLPQEEEEEEEDYMLWLPSSPSSAPKSPNKSVRFLGHEDSRNSPSTTLNDSIGPGDRTRMLEASWARERAEVSRKAGEVGALRIDDDELEEDTMEAEKIIADMWEVEAEPRSEDTPAKPRGERRGLAPESSPPGKVLSAQSSPIGERTMLQEKMWQEEREEVVKKAKEVGWISVHDTIEEQEGEKEKEEPQQLKLKLQPQRRTSKSQPQFQPEEEQEDQYGAHLANSTTLLSQDTAAFEESLFHREQQQMHPPSGTLFTSSSTPYKRGSSISSQQTESSRSSPPPETDGKGIRRWRGAKRMDGGSITPLGVGATTVKATTTTKATTPAKAAVETTTEKKGTTMDIPKTTTSERIARTAARLAALEKGKNSTKKDTTVEKIIPTVETTKENIHTADAKGKGKERESFVKPTPKSHELPKQTVELEVPEEESVNMLTEDLLTPPILQEVHTPPDVLTPPDSFTATPEEPPVVAPPPTRSRPARQRAPRASEDPASNAAPKAASAPRRSRATKSTTGSTAAPTLPPRVGPIWEKRHWRLLERFLHSSKTVPPPDSRLTYQISIDDPAALGPDYESLLADPELNVTTMESGEKALVLCGKEVEAVKRFMERMAKEGGEVEKGWGVEMVAGKVGALKVTGVRRRIRESKEESMKQKGRGKKVERVVGNERRGTLEKDSRSPVGKGHGVGERKKGGRLSDWL